MNGNERIFIFTIISVDIVETTPNITGQNKLSALAADETSNLIGNIPLILICLQPVSASSRFLII